MFGESLLVAPKLGEPQKLSAAMNGIYNVQVYLPNSYDWYLNSNKELIAGATDAQNIVVGDAEYPTFIKAGSIIPILNFELNRMSITQAIDDNLRIEVYPDSSNAASGVLYLDDYTSHRYVDGEYSLVNYSWDGSKLSVTKAANSYFFKASNKIINEIQIMNVSEYPE
jgi:alpha-glucosidase (family GH31 glycosyl hydrolase)